MVECERWRDGVEVQVVCLFQKVEMECTRLVALQRLDKLSLFST